MSSGIGKASPLARASRISSVDLLRGLACALMARKGGASARRSQVHLTGPRHAMKVTSSRVSSECQAT